MKDTAIVNISRAALVVHRQPAFFEWVKEKLPDFETFEDMMDGNVYLIPDFETKEEIEAWLKTEYIRFFEQELFDWFTDPGEWMSDRSFSVFQRMFRYSIHPMVFDSVDEEIEYFD